MLFPFVVQNMVVLFYWRIESQNLRPAFVAVDDNLKAPQRSEDYSLCYKIDSIVFVD